MLRDKFLKSLTPSVESVDPAIVESVQSDVVAAVDDAMPAVVESPVVAEPVASDAVVPTESELPATTEPEVAAVLSSTEQPAEPVVTEPVVEGTVLAAEPAAPVDAVIVEPVVVVDPVVVSTEDDKSDDDTDKEAKDAPVVEVNVQVPETTETTEAPAEPETDVEGETTEPAAEPAEGKVDETTEPAETTAEPVEGGESVDAEPEATETPAPGEAEPAPSESEVAAEPAAEPATPESTDTAEPAAEFSPSEGETQVEGEQSADSTEPAAAEGSDDATSTEGEGEGEGEGASDVVEAAAELDAAAEPGQAEVPVEEPTDASERYADELLELNALNDESEQLDVSIESLVARMASLESIAADLSELRSTDEQLTPEAAQMLQSAVDTETDGLVEQSPIPSLESFYGRTAATKSLAVSCEGVQSAIKTVWSWIRAALIKAAELFGRVWRAIMDSSAHLSSYADNTLKRAERTDESQLKSSSTVVVTATTQGRLSINGRPMVKTLDAELSNIAELVNEVVMEFDASMIEQAKVLLSRLSAVDLDNPADTLPTLPNIRIPKLMRRVGAAVDNKDMDVYEYNGKLLGDVTVAAQIPNISGMATRFTAWTHRNHAMLELQGGNGSEKPVQYGNSNSENRLPVLPVSVIVDIATSAKAIADRARKSRSQYDNAERYKAMVLKAGDDFSAQHAEETDARLATAKVIVNALGAYSRNIGKGSTAITNYAMRCSDAALRYCNACLDYHSKAKSAAASE